MKEQKCVGVIAHSIIAVEFSAILPTLNPRGMNLLSDKIKLPLDKLTHQCLTGK